MPELSVRDVVEATGGRLLRGEPDVLLRAYGIDTRALAADSLFFALKGEHTDGHKFLPQAAEAGAAAAVIDSQTPTDARGPRALIRVDDVRSALTACGKLARERLASTRFVAITGSNGKTTTKELLAAGLGAKHRVHKTPGNFNNELGVPLTLLACPADAEWAVCELAMSGFGEIGALTELVRPDLGLITNIRAVHLEFFRSVEDIAAAKGEMFAVLSPEATAVYNVDNLHIRVQVTRHTGRQVSFGRAEQADVRILDLANRFLPGSSLVVAAGDRQWTVHLKLGGAHSAFNALAAIAAVLAADEDVDAAIQAMQQVEPGTGRGKVHRLGGGLTLVDDSYNSSPAALASVLETLRRSETAGRKVVVMGDMLELGPVAGALHREAGNRAAACGVGLFFSVGTLSRQSAESARQAGVELVQHYNDADEAAGSIGEFLREGDLVLVKGSRGIRLEKVVSRLRERFGEEA